MLITCVIHCVANPSLRMPPGNIVVAESPITDIGAIAARCGGRRLATNSCVMPGYDSPTMPTLPFATHGCAATVSMAS
ncbi:MAG: hypothetical protein NT062_38545 [Proteobacteria bacterium]|nr:hypothetical protein [Pseudomonadota bacterium]